MISGVLAIRIVTITQIYPKEEPKIPKASISLRLTLPSLSLPLSLPVAVYVSVSVSFYRY